MQLPLRWLIPLGTFVLRIVPRPVAVAVATAVADALFFCLPDRRRILEENVSHIVPGWDTPDRYRIARDTFRNFALMWVDFLRLPSLTTEEIHALVVWDTRENLDAALEAGRGVIIVTLHLGGVDLSGAYLASRGYRLSAVAEDVEPRLFEVLRQYRSCTGMEVLPRRNPLGAFRALTRGGVLALVADRLIDGPGIAVEFCGGLRTMPTGPAALALRTGAPLVVTYLARLREPCGSALYRFVSEPMRMPSGSPEELTRVVAAQFSRIVRAHPDEWFVFQPQWIEEPSQERRPAASASA